MLQIIASCVTLLVSLSVAKRPIILIHGIGDSKIEAKVDKLDLSLLCTLYKSKDFYVIWPQKAFQWTLTSFCILQILTLFYEKSNWKRGKNKEFVETRIFENDFSSLDSIRNVDGFNRDEKYNKKLQKLVEKAYELTGEKVSLFGHSIGALYANIFINSQSPEWVYKHININIAVSAPWKGMILALHDMAVGNHYNYALNVDIDWRKSLRSFQGNLGLTPFPKKWESTDPIVVSKSKNYTAKDLSNFYNDIDFLNGSTRFNSIVDIFQNIEPTKSDSMCLYGDGHLTLSQLVYKRDISKNYELPTFRFKNGDNVTTQNSLMWCDTWPSDRYRKVRKIENSTHYGILNNQDMLDDVMKTINRDISNQKLILPGKLALVIKHLTQSSKSC
ncbi:hypothetical protein A3Q56_05339 [Intoshia linei]|uniref:Uncharacterized protein n=1 Tax=Intoshia linei TaxID=1819745 RepID=A0A177AYJ9_9BILA|nr:hypothetical protein A3Q56_05339 [Intoshia linei]